MPSPAIRYRMDWDADGLVQDADTMTTMLAQSPADQLEDVTRYVRHQPLTSIEFGRDRARSFAPAMVGKSDYLLNNDTGIFSSQDSASPLATKLKPGRLIDIEAQYSGISYGLCETYSEEPEERPLLSEKSVRFLGLDGLGRAEAAGQVYTDMYLSIRTDQAIGYVLDAMGWSATKRILSQGKTTPVRWWATGRSAFQEIKDLVLSEGPGAVGGVDGDGNFVFEDRHYRLLTSRSLNSQATFRDTGTEPLFSGFRLIPSDRDIINQATIPVRAYTLSALTTIWTGPTPITMAPNESRTFTVSVDGDGFDEAVNPTSGGGDYTLTQGSISSATLNRDGGKLAILTIVAGSAGATFTGLRVRGKTVTITTQLVDNTVNTTASKDAHGLRQLKTEFIPSWVPTYAEAEDHANALVIRYQEEVLQIEVSVNNGTDGRLVQGLTRKLSDRITVIDAGISKFNDAVMIEAIRRQFDPDGNTFVTSWLCEVADDTGYWVLGDPTLGVLGTTTRLGY